MGIDKHIDSMKLPPSQCHVNSQLDFYAALKECVIGTKICRAEWNDRDYYGLMKDGVLTLHKPDGKFYNWIVTVGDILGIDWFLLN